MVYLQGNPVENVLNPLEAFVRLAEATSFTPLISRNMVRHSGTTLFANHCNSIHCVHSQSSRQAPIKSGRHLTLH